MDSKLLAPFPAWVTAVHGLTLALSLLVIAIPEVRSLPVRALLALLFFFIFFQSILRLKRAHGLRTTMQDLAQHLPPTHSFREALALIAITVGGLTQALAF